MLNNSARRISSRMQETNKKNFSPTLFPHGSSEKQIFLWPNLSKASDVEFSIRIK